MLRRRHLLRATALSLTLASCAVPTAGTNSVGAPAPTTPAVPLAAPTPPAAPVAVPSLAPAPPVAADARQRLTGSVVFNDAPVANATLTAIDLATGKALPLKAWSDPGSGAAGTQRTDAKGAFDVELPKLADDQIVKLVAVGGSQTFTALFDARGRAVGAAGVQGASYRLAQGRTITLTIRLKLTASSTAAAKAFEGALKLTFQVPKAAREAERAAALAAAEAAARRIEAAFAAKPELASDLVASVGPDGEVRDLDGFRSVMARLGVFDPVFEAVQGRLVAVTAQKLTVEGTLDAITAEDFPLDRVTIRPDGGFGFTGGSRATVLGGGLTANFVPTPTRRRSRRAPEPVEEWVVTTFATLTNEPLGVTVNASGTLYVTSGPVLWQAPSTGGALTVLAGGTTGFVNDTGSAARFDQPQGIAANASGTLYVADWFNHAIRQVTATGVVTTLAGKGPGFNGDVDGTGDGARFFLPDGVAVDTSGNVFVSDFGNHRIRQVTATGVVTTLAGSTPGFAEGTGSNARFNWPRGLAVDPSGHVYVADARNHRIRKIAPGGVVTTFAGSGTSGHADGPGAVAQFDGPSGLALDASGNLFVAEDIGHRIRKITPAGVVTTVAGAVDGSYGDVDGVGPSARFFVPSAITVDPLGNLYVADRWNNKVRKVTRLP